MFNCNQCGASTPDECNKRHAAQRALHDSIETERGAMHRTVDAIVDGLISRANFVARSCGADPTFDDFQRSIPSAGLLSASAKIYKAARDINVMIADWRRS